METLVYSVRIGEEKILIAGIVEIKEKMYSYVFMGRKGVVLGIIPKKLNPIIIVSNVFK